MMRRKGNEWTAMAAAALLAAGILAACGFGHFQVPGDGVGAGRLEPEKLVIAIQPNTMVTDYDDNYLTRRLEEDLNIDIEFVLLPLIVEERNAMLSMMAAGKEYGIPDVICARVTDVQQNRLGKNGFLIPLQDYLNDPDATPYFHSVPSEEDRDYMLRELTEPDGNIYGLPRYMPNIFDVNETPFRFYINRTWLDRLGLSVPETTDELYDVLKAFAERDPNGNGIPDEIPLYGFMRSGTNGADVVLMLMNAFLFAPDWEVGIFVLDEDGTTVTAPFAQDEWRDGLEYLHRLCAEGLMPESVFTDDLVQYKAALGNPDVNLVGVTGSSTEVPWQGNPDNMYDMEIMEPVTGPQGVCYTPYIPAAPAGGWFVTSACKNPGLAVKVGDYFYNQEISIISRYGEPGVNWTDDPELVKDPAYSNSLIDSGLWTGERYIVELDPAWERLNNKLWGNINPIYRTSEFFAGVLMPSDGESETPDGTVNPRDSAYWNYMYYSDKVPRERYISKFGYTLEENDQAALITDELYAYVERSAAQFITGARVLDDAGWEAYKADLERLGLSEVLEISQTAWDRNHP